MKINGLTTPGGTTAGERTGGARPARKNPGAGGTAEVRLSPAATELATSAAETTVDVARVQEIRQAISEGRFQINSGAIADRLIATARELVDSQRKA